MPNSVNLLDATGYYKASGAFLNINDATGYYATKTAVLNLADATGYEQILSRMSEWDWEDNIWKGRKTLLLSE